MDRVNPTRKYNTINFTIPKNDAHQRFFAVASLLFLCSLLFVPFSTHAAAISLPPNNLGLVGYWSFNEGSGNVATDFSGNGNHGSLVNGPQWVNGKLGNALDFDGSGDHISLTSTSIIPTSGDFTIAFWVNADNTPLLTLVRDNEDYYIYLDGENMPLATTPTAHPQAGTCALTIGIQWTNNDCALNNIPAYFGYSFDDPRIYNRALGPDEVRQLYRMGQ